MELDARDAAFVLDAMTEIERSETRRPSEKRAAQRVRRKAEAVLTE